MSELGTNPLWGSRSIEFPSQYARMILGTPAEPRTAAAATEAEASVVDRGHSAGRGNSSSETETATPVSQRRSHRPLPAPTRSRFLLCQLIAADSMVVVAVCAVASFFRGWGLPWACVPVFAVLVALVSFCQGLYARAGDPFPVGIFLALARSTSLAFLLVFIAARNAITTLGACVVLIGSLGALLLARRVRKVTWKRRCKNGARNVLIVGDGPIARSVAQGLRNDPSQLAIVCGILDDDHPLSPTVLGRIADLEWLARAEFVDEIILAVPGEPAQAREAAAIAIRNHLDILAVPDLPPGQWADLTLDRIGEVPVVTLHREPLPSASLFLKRLLDVVGAALSLILASPLMATVALLIRLDSPGPVVYAAERTGAKGRPFRCYKFRSMVTDAEQLKEQLRARNQREGPIFKIDDDPRITRVGRLIRRYSLDELPQLWNVLCGEMSLVGPRPHPVEEVNHYELQHYRRLDVKPGITGLWQITARDCPSFELNMHLDLTYIENWSLYLDLRILFSTVRVLFVPAGA